MELYIKRDESLDPINLRDLIALAIEKETAIAEVRVGTDCYSDRSASWVEVKETRETKVITLMLEFDVDGNSLKDISVYDTPIKKIVDEDNSKKII